MPILPESTCVRVLERVKEIAGWLLHQPDDVGRLRQGCTADIFKLDEAPISGSQVGYASSEQHCSATEKCFIDVYSYL